MMRVGIGYDAHKLSENRRLVLGGVEIPYEKGLLGHSDADVLIHAIMDSLLGACGKGDIGKIFPDTDDSFKDVSSLVLLKKIREIIYENGYSIINIDSVIVAQKPKLSKYIHKMVENIAGILEISTDCVNVKATTTEGMGFCGKGEGISAYAVSCLDSKN
ncbi:MAG: 2-C-methyl-D-erythritol 2,4-cyclodiphosphate synthase [Thermosediminibacterales bacterium]|nr:2-C-methyl-D-erythritol 2,4-cyclodiphosphate synthase [Thermosediminibacterales bacterium]MDK2836395.1 2-C-methyl-D-erythritol 2,4-cyclodiphosphate synthase [Thermosediminibacterales bacterium]